MNFHLKFILGMLLVSMMLSSCKIWNPNSMFGTKSDYAYTELDNFEPVDYRIQSGDRLAVSILTNGGFALINPNIAESRQGGGSDYRITYEVDIHGVVKLPRIDTVYIRDLTVRQTEELLEKHFSEYFEEPFVKLEVTNRRVFVFRGSDEAEVVMLENENMTLVEVLALAGGVPETGKAYEIKILRGDISEPQISKINLRKVEEIHKVNLLVQANDVIYIDPVINTTLLREMAPIIGFVSSSIALYAVVISLNNR